VFLLLQRSRRQLLMLVVVVVVVIVTTLQVHQVTAALCVRILLVDNKKNKNS
jgi:NhaP-type Na+/H+ or K+/H+ antiporter